MVRIGGKIYSGKKIAAIAGGAALLGGAAYGASRLLKRGKGSTAGANRARREMARIRRIIRAKAGQQAASGKVGQAVKTLQLLKFL